MPVDAHLQETGKLLKKEAGLRYRGHADMEKLEQLLAERLEQLISQDFQQFVVLLYTVDVSEKKIKDILAGEGNEDAYLLIARLIIERQLQKVKSRAASRESNPGEWMDC
jgi:ribosome-associated translation inhibitor RaiA